MARVKSEQECGKYITNQNFIKTFFTDCCIVSDNQDLDCPVRFSSKSRNTVNRLKRRLVLMNILKIIWESSFWQLVSPISNKDLCLDTVIVESGQDHVTPCDLSQGAAFHSM